MNQINISHNNHENKQINNQNNNNNKNIQNEQYHDLKQLLKFKQERFKYTASEQLKQSNQKDLKMMYPEIVKKILQRQKPFQTQLESIRKQSLKTVRLPNNDIYHGQLDQLFRPQGFGSVLQSNNNFLVGNFINGVLQGDVFFIFTSNGSYYKGLMKDNRAHDLKGVYNCDKFMYVGGFQNNMFNGDGQEIGEEYYFKGDYKDNFKVKGVLKWGAYSNQNGNTNLNIQRYENSNESKMIKQQQKTHQHIQTSPLLIPPQRSLSTQLLYPYTYQGSFIQSQLFTGFATLTSPTGTYKGQFNQGKKHGKGIYFYKSQLKYDGEYYQDKKSGYGILYNCDNTIAYEGEWKDGLPHGNGTSYDLKGKKTEGKFKNGLNVNLLQQDAKSIHNDIDDNNRRPF